MGSCLSIAPTSKIENDNNLHPSSNPPMTPTLHIPPQISSYTSSVVPSTAPPPTLSVSQTPLDGKPIYIPPIQHLNSIKNNNRNSNYFESNSQSNYYHGNHLGFDYGGCNSDGGCDSGCDSGGGGCD